MTPNMALWTFLVRFIETNDALDPQIELAVVEQPDSPRIAELVELGFEPVVLEQFMEAWAERDDLAHRRWRRAMFPVIPPRLISRESAGKG